MPFEPVGDCFYRWEDVFAGYTDVIKAGKEKLLSWK
jgi:hypothetical protein